MSYDEDPKAKSMYAAALVTPPKQDTKETLIASNPNANVAPFTPIQNTSECGGQQQDNIEPLPYQYNIFEGSPFSPNANGHLLQLVYSPLQANTHRQSTSKSEVDKQEFYGDHPPPLLGAPANFPNEKMPPLPRSEHKKHYAKKPPLPPVHQPHQWHSGVYPPPPPPPYYWGYYHGYHHHPYGNQGDARASHNPRVSHPTLYPKPQYHPPAAAQQEFITDVTNNDVICGRGGAVNNHAGNRRFRKFIQEFKHQYLNEVKQRKPAVAMRVLEAVKPGRFLVKHPGGYVICPEDRAREKASQALREGAAKLRKEAAKTQTSKRSLPSKTEVESEGDQDYKDDDKYSVFEQSKKRVKLEPV